MTEVKSAMAEAGRFQKQLEEIKSLEAENKKLREELILLERNLEVRTGITDKQRRKTYIREPSHKFKDIS